MGKIHIKDIDRDRWLHDMFPEWGTWLNEEIQMEEVKPGTFAMWWLGCTGLWIKSEGNANLMFDLWVGTGKRTHDWPFPYGQGRDHQIIRMVGSQQIQQNTRTSPMVLDPFAIEDGHIDAVFSTHYHLDHIDKYVAAAVVKNTKVPFIGPELSVQTWRDWGVPEDRLITLKPGDTWEIKDTKVIATEAFDRTALITTPPEGDLRGTLVADMDPRAVNYVIETPGGTIYHSGDSHFSNHYFKHGRDFDIDVCLTSFGENVPGVTDKMTASDCLRAAENLQAKVLIPVHHDIWSNMMADPREIQLLWEFKRHRLQYKFTPYTWNVGGKFVFPDDAERREHNFPRGFTDAFHDLPNIPYPSFL